MSFTLRIIAGNALGIILTVVAMATFNPENSLAALFKVPEISGF